MTTPSNRVTAVFRDATLLAFDLHPHISLGELAVQIGDAATPHGGLILPVQVRLKGGLSVSAVGRTATNGANQTQHAPGVA